MVASPILTTTRCAKSGSVAELTNSPTTHLGSSRRQQRQASRSRVLPPQAFTVQRFRVPPALASTIDRSTVRLPGPHPSFLKGGIPRPVSRVGFLADFGSALVDRVHR